MAFVRKREQSQLPSYFKQRTNAEQVRFLSAQSGDTYIFEMTNNPTDQAARGISIPTGPGIPPNTIDVALPFHFFVGLKHLKVWKLNTSSGELTEIIRRREYPGVGSSVATVLDPNSAGFDEVRSNQVRVYNAFAGDVYRVGFNHTAAPAMLGEKQVIKNQPDNIGLELEGEGDGIVLVTPSGQRVRLYVNSGLTLSVEKL